MKFECEPKWGTRDTLWCADVTGTNHVTFTRVEIAGVEIALANRGKDAPHVVQYSVYIGDSNSTKHISEKSLIDAGYATSRDEAIILCKSKLINEKNEKMRGYKELAEEEAELCRKRVEALDSLFGKEKSV